MSSPPQLVLLPGMDGTGRLFAPFTAVLAEVVRTTVVEYPGQGALGYPELEAIARAHLPVDGPYVLLAESFSGPIGIAIAASHPPGLRGLILCCTFASNPLPILSPLRHVVGALPLPVLPIRLIGHALFGAFTTEKLLALLQQALEGVAPEAIRARIQGILRIDVRRRLARVDVPVLYLQASQDQVIRADAARTIRSGIPSVEMVSIDGPHCLLQTKPAAAAVVVERLLSRLGELGRGDGPR